MRASAKPVDVILDDAADILEKHGFTTSMCFNPDTGGFCALGAIARAAYPKTVSNDDIDDIAMNDPSDPDCFPEYVKVNPRYMHAVEATARTIKGTKKTPDRARSVVYEYNDAIRQGKFVVKMLRKAAARVRKEAANA